MRATAVGLALAMAAAVLIFLPSNPAAADVKDFACSNSGADISWSDHGDKKFWIYKSVDDGNSYQWLNRSLGGVSHYDDKYTDGAKYQVHYNGLPRIYCTDQTPAAPVMMTRRTITATTTRKTAIVPVATVETAATAAARTVVPVETAAPVATAMARTAAPVETVAPASRAPVMMTRRTITATTTRKTTTGPVIVTATATTTRRTTATGLVTATGTAGWVGPGAASKPTQLTNESTIFC